MNNEPENHRLSSILKLIFLLFSTPLSVTETTRCRILMHALYTRDVIIWFFFHQHYSAVSVLSSSSVYVHITIYKHIAVCLPLVLLKHPLLRYASGTTGITNSLLSRELLPQGKNTSILFFIPCYGLKLQSADIPSYEFPSLTEDGNSDLIWARLWVTCPSFWVSPALSRGLDWRPGILSSYSVIWFVSFCRGYFRVSDVYENNSRAEVPPWQRTSTVCPFAFSHCLKQSWCCSCLW